jgi:hypothetical protein
VGTSTGRMLIDGEIYTTSEATKVPSRMSDSLRGPRVNEASHSQDMFKRNDAVRLSAPKGAVLPRPPLRRRASSNH